MPVDIGRVRKGSEEKQIARQTKESKEANKTGTFETKTSNNKTITKTRWVAMEFVHLRFTMFTNRKDGRKTGDPAGRWILVKARPGWIAKFKFAPQPQT